MSANISDDLRLFLAEMTELVEILEDGLLRLEKSPDPDVVAEAFRAAHTLKGSSATIGFTEMAQVTHAMEDLLDSWREGLAVNPDQVSLLFEGLDWLNEAKSRLEGGGECPPGGDLVARLRGSAGHRNTAGAVDKSPGTPVEGVEAEAESPTGAAGPATPWPAALQAEIEAAVSKGYRAFEIHAGIDPSAVMPSVRAFQFRSAMEDLGKVPWSDPSVDQIEQDEVGSTIDLLLLTDTEHEEILKAARNVVEIASVDVTAVQVQSRSAPPRQKAGGRVLGSSVRLDVEVLDSLMNLIGELIVDRTRLVQVTGGIHEAEDLEELEKNLGGISARIARISTQLQEGIMRARLVPLQNLVRKYPRMVRDLASTSGKEVNFIIEGEQTELDRSVIEAIDDPLIHILRNSVDHGIEAPGDRVRAGKPRTGTVRLTATHQENQVVIVIEDDGKGIDPEGLRESAVRKGLMTEESARRLSDEQAIELIFLPGFSTKAQVSEVSGRGVGMDVVNTNLKRINGTIDVKTKVGRGTKFTLRLPLTLAIIQALLVSAGDNVYAMPLSMVSEAVNIEPESVYSVRGKPVIRVRDRIFPLIDLDAAFFPSGEERRREYAVITVDYGAPIAIAVDNLLGQQEVVVKNLGKFFGTIGGISGATILGDGDLALIVDVTRMIQAQQTEESLELYDEAAS
ncbi:MAG: chemotaxis protein CheW [Ignavibacteriales bacterium]